MKPATRFLIITELKQCCPKMTSGERKLQTNPLDEFNQEIEGRRRKRRKLKNIKNRLEQHRKVKR